MRYVADATMLQLLVRPLLLLLLALLPRLVQLLRASPPGLSARFLAMLRLRLLELDSVAPLLLTHVLGLGQPLLLLLLRLPLPRLALLLAGPLLLCVTAPLLLVTLPLLLPLAVWLLILLLLLLLILLLLARNQVCACHVGGQLFQPAAQLPRHCQVVCRRHTRQPPTGPPALLRAVTAATSTARRICGAGVGRRRCLRSRRGRGGDALAVLAAAARPIVQAT